MTHTKKWVLFLIVIFAMIIVTLPAQAGGTEILVTTTADSGEGSLREAILTANRQTNTTIRFAIDTQRPYVIQLESALPEITASVIIDGESECATNSTPSDMRVAIDGSELPGGDGLYLTAEATGSTIRGLSIVGFTTGAGIYIDGARDVIVACNHLGIDTSGIAAIPNDIGVYSQGEELNLRIGSIDTISRNVISGNLRYGVRATSFATVSNNYVGTDATGQYAVGNELSGIYFDGVQEGGLAFNNLVSGNGEMGFLVDNSESISIFGNYVGTNAQAVAAIPNALSGVYIRDSFNISVGDADGGNIVSGNAEMGVLIRSSNNITVQNNYIGLSLNGDFAIPNGLSGVGVSEGSNDVVIGGELGISGNVISGNTQIGIRISDEGTSRNTIIGNFIGTDPTGTYAIANELSGIYLRAGANENMIGTGIYAERNIISGNLQAGAVINAASNNRIQGNFIGTDITGTYSIPNAFSGVSIEGGASNNIIGGNIAGAGNLISGNTELGVYLADAGTSGNVIQGNYIGTDITGTYSIANGYSGVGAFAGASDTIIGGLSLSERNIISGNGQFGIAANGVGTSGMLIQNNLIGLDVTGEIALPNSYGGIVVEAGATDVTIGGNTPEARNVISGNSYSGIAVRDVGTARVTIQGNFIGSAIGGQTGIPNAINGVRITEFADAVQLGGENRGEGNLVAFNTIHGVYVDNVTDVLITGNAILSNGGAGVYFPTNDSGTTLGRNDFKRNCSNPPSDIDECVDVVGE
ncbi:MAG: right-handed parallel beta-helix repeat-containing protein [bacterium]|nr:right-handed parallel beta-helix repeat-containing protein [bacterium]